MKKKLLTLFLSTLFICSNFSNAFANIPDYTPFKPKALDYAYDALEPYISKETMVLHHDKHYMTYLEKLNNIIKTHPELYNASIYELLSCLDCLPSDVAQDIKNNGGGVYNHEFFFDIITSKKTAPSKNLNDAIIRDFGSFDNFKEQFKKSALNVFGSGWTWLVSNKEGNLSIVNTSNQDNPISINLKPIIGIDVWEHAYYLSYKNNRSNYIDSWFNVVNWEKALENYNKK
ncbi:superoxide dismutase [Faecalimicrobium dakarense]|uniref:superoxide dismutase n=1 Tax=Faecalimicrobium dakarense TaxID=1301100 RepID=UPI0004AC63D2|nr:superoxide dismutase [[Clostridium] dakarense]